MKPNKYRGWCYFCTAFVAPNAGMTWRVGDRNRVAHLTCLEAQAPSVVTIELADGVVLTQNRKGRCEDAPCCGCCTC